MATTSESINATDSRNFAFDSLEAVRKNLLDLTGRNSLISYRHTKTNCVRLIDELPDQIIAALRSGQELTFVPVPRPTEPELIENGYVSFNPETGEKEDDNYPTAEQWAAHLGLVVAYDLPDKQVSEEEKAQHNDNDLQTVLYMDQLEARLRNLRNKAETATEESGCNFLHLGLGFLEWYEHTDSDAKRLAPLFTLPVQLIRSKRINAGAYQYSIRLKDDGLFTNITLREKLANDFGLVLPSISDETDPEDYFEEVERLILVHQPKWSIKRQATLLLLNFSKQAMYADLDPDNWPDDANIKDHPLVGKFFGTSETDPSDASSGYAEEYLIDQEVAIHDKFPLIFEADSSQHSALIDAVNGKNLVIEGPPGTGKSQTITNLIAACLANGQRVLFVAEKMAALNVVKNRLDKAGLGDFCLELHSHKTNKQKILNDLSARINRAGDYAKPKEIKAEIARFEALKVKLHDYAELINQPCGETGLTLHEVFNKATRYREQLKFDPGLFAIKDINIDNVPPEKSKEIFDQVESLSGIYSQVAEQAPSGNIENHYWYGATNVNLMDYEVKALNDSLLAWNDELCSLDVYWDEFREATGILDGSDTELEHIWQFSKYAEWLPPLVGGEVFDFLPGLISQHDELRDCLIGYEKIHDTDRVLLEAIHGDAIRDLDSAATLQQELAVFQQLGVAPQTTLAELGDCQKQVISTKSDIQKLEQQFTQIRDSAPAELKHCFVLNTLGVIEFSTLIQLMNGLSDDLWQQRNAIFDNRDLDSLLPELERQLALLTPIHHKLESHFNLEALPDASTLGKWNQVISGSGVFSGLSSEYRAVVKDYLALASQAKPDKKALLLMLADVVAYAEIRQNLEQLASDNTALQGLYRGVNTDIEAIVQLRKWYKSVRTEYGSGFGVRVSMGDALFAINRDFALRLKDDCQQGLYQDVVSVSKAIANCKDTFPDYLSLRDEGTLLFGAVDQLSSMLSKSLSQLESVVLSEQHSISALLVATDLLVHQQSNISKWDSLPITQWLTGVNGLSLSSTLNSFSQQSLDTAKNMLLIVKVLEKCSLLTSSLQMKPDVERYNHLKACVPALQHYEKKCAEFQMAFVKPGEVKIADWLASSQGRIKALIQRNKGALSNPNWLSTWLDYIRLRIKLSGQGLDNIVQRLEDDTITTDELNTVVRATLYHQLASEVLASNAALSTFSGMEQMEIRAQFQKYDRNLLLLQRQLVAYKASCAEAPQGINTGRVGDYTEIGLIRYNLNLKKPRIAVRSLIKRAPKSIQAFKPCFMMSPMSVAQYLEPGKFNFDVLIMDEASQIKPEDALGSIARAKALVVVGDPKQLPPTTFFQKMTNTGDGENVVALQDSDSILQAVIPMFQNRRLRWHYRSRHESLIAFSNYHFYDSNLVLFPSPFQNSDEFGIRFKRVEEGCLIDRRNLKEAKEIVDFVEQQLVDQPNESIGIVAMNAEQSEEISLQLEQRTKENPVFKKAYEHNQTLEMSERVFVKNLENVQGDERDVIVISMTYGPETVGAASMHQRFGPINSDVGWRRLNVLFTRSKKRMHIFSSMDSGHVRTSEQSKRGVIALKDFLIYCETGNLQSYTHTGKAPDSDFEIAVMDALKAHGYECEPQLGVTGYFLDLAVKDPGMPGCFLMGIECDGASYHSAKSTRDRDRLRQDILENLGWRIRRIWSTDWFKNPQAQLQPILNELETLRTSRIDPVQSTLALDATNVDCE